MTTSRQTLLALFHEALSRMHGAALTRDSIADLRGEFALVALGKAAAAMTEGALAAPSVTFSRGFVCAVRGYGEFTPPATGDWRAHQGGHPVPDEASFAAGADLVQWLSSLPPRLPLLVLMSGGSSACVEHLREGLEPDEVIARTRQLLASSADIRSLNTARSEWSALKHGRALKLAGLRDIQVRVLADVPGDDPAIVGSGPFYGHAPSLDIRVVAGNMTMVAILAETAHGMGFPITLHGALSGDAARMGATIAKTLQAAAPGVHLWGGETTVALPERPGRGGRCQHLALAAAMALDGDARVTLLSATTDGVDGDSADAGALVDGGTLERLREQGVDTAAALAAADSGTALEAAGELLHTGPTGTNVMDVVIALVT